MPRYLTTHIGAVILVTLATAPSVRAQRVVVDVGTTQVTWLSPENRGATIGLQVASPRRRGAALIGSVRGILGLEWPREGPRRSDRDLSLAIGVEQSLARTQAIAFYGAASVAGSYTWSTYTGISDAQRVSGFGWVRPIVALRAEQRRNRGPRLGLRADVQPYFSGRYTWNPSLGLSASF